MRLGRGHGLVLASVAVTAVVASPLAVPAWADGPAPVSALELSTSDAWVAARWTSSPDTSQAKVCWALNTPPSSPDDIGAQCSEVLSSPRYSFSGVDGQTYGVSVFSYEPTASAYGSPVSDTIIAEDQPPVAVEDLHSVATPNSSSYVDLTWTDPRNRDTKNYEVSVREGMDTPDYDPVLDSTTTDKRWFASGLKPGQVYTVAVRAQDKGNHVGPPAVLHLTGRLPGLSAVDDRNDTVHRDHVSTAARSAAVSGQDDGHLRAVYVENGRVFYTSRVRSQKWGDPVSVSGEHRHNGLRDTVISSTAKGDVAVAWSAEQGVVVAQRVSGHWRTRHASRHSGDRAVGVTLDDRGNLHVLVRRTTAKGGGLLLLTRHGRHFTADRLAGSGRYDVGLVTQDRDTHDVVVVDQHDGSRRSTVRLAVLRPAADRIRATRTILDRARDETTVTPTSVTSAGGRVTVAVERRTGSHGAAGDGIFVVSATARSVGGLVRVPHTTARASAPTVAAFDGGHVVVSWRRTDPSWSPDIVGVWATELVRGGGSWSADAPRRWSSSAYDVPTGAFRDDRGHVYTTYVTETGDVTE